MITLCIRYRINPNLSSAFQKYVDAEQPVIRRSGGKIAGYYLPTDYAGATNEALGLIDFETLAAYEQYRAVLAADPEHKKNVAELEASGAVLEMNRSFLKKA